MNRIVKTNKTTIKQYKPHRKPNSSYIINAGESITIEVILQPDQRTCSTVYISFNNEEE